MKNKKKVLCVFAAAICVFMFGVCGIIFAITGGISANLEFDRAWYVPGDSMVMNLILTNVQVGDKTNSVTFQVDYDGSAFELATGDPLVDIADGYITFTTKSDLGTGTAKRIEAMYVSLGADTVLQEGETVFSVNFKVKSATIEGSKAFTLRKVNMIDSTSKVYVVNDAHPLIKNIQIYPYVKPGDCNNDDEVNLYDLVILSLAYGSDSTNSNGRWNAKADMNRDNKVDALDFGILKQNYNN